MTSRGFRQRSFHLGHSNNMGTKAFAALPCHRVSAIIRASEFLEDE